MSWCLVFLVKLADPAYEPLCGLQQVQCRQALEVVAESLGDGYVCMGEETPGLRKMPTSRYPSLAKGAL